MDLIALSAAKNYANKVTAGFKSVEINGMNLTFTLLDDTKATIAIPAPANGKDGKDGVSVQNLSIDKDGSLLCHMSDGTTLDAGKVPMTDIELTDYYTKEEADKNLKDAIEEIPEVDLTNYYTKEEVNTVVSNIDIPETDLTNYYSKSEIGTINTVNGYEDNDTLVECINNIDTSKAIVNIHIANSTALGFDKEYSLSTYETREVKAAMEKYYGRSFILHLMLSSSDYGNHMLIPINCNRAESGMTLTYNHPGIWMVNGVPRLRTLQLEVYHNTAGVFASLKAKLLPCSENESIATKADIATALAGIDIPEVNVNDFYKKSEIGNITSLVGWKSNEDTVISYFNRNPGIYDILITSSIDDPATAVTISGSNLDILLQMVKNHKDKCF